MEGFQSWKTRQERIAKGRFPMLIFRKPLPTSSIPKCQPTSSSSAADPPAWPAPSAFPANRRPQHPPSDAPLSKENIYVLEKAREAGQHCLSGALLDPRSMKELLPDSRAKHRSTPRSTRKRFIF